MDISTIYDAENMLKKIIYPTSLIHATKISPDGNIYLKPENLQVTGSFKVRGAAYKISKLSEDEKKNGVIACSAGNHAQGVALASAKNGIKSIICLPSNAPLSKVEATKRNGAEVVLVDGVYDDAYTRALEMRDEYGYTFIHPFDDEYVIAGQGTIGLEIIRDLPETEAVIVPIGGGGLISGIAYTIKTLKPSVKVYGVQSEGASSMRDSILHGAIESLSSVSTIADGIAVKQPGKNTFDYCNKYVDEIVTVNEDEISTAILTLMEQEKLVSEGAGAVSIAAAMFGKLPVKDKKTVCVVSGGNIDVTILSRVIQRGLVKTGRTMSVCLELIDKPGQLRDVSRILAECGGNVIAVHHEHGATGDLNGCYLRITLETRNYEHIKVINEALRSNGFKIVE